MAFARCGTVDPFTRRVREVYHANVLRAPRAGIDPLEVLARLDRQIDARGQIPGMLVDGDAITFPKAAPRPAVELAGVRSTSLDLTIGGKLTSNFLAALGLPIPGAEVTTTLWSGAQTLTFEVHDVVEFALDVLALGKAMSRARIDDTPATRLFLTNRAVSALLITRTLQSSRFSVQAQARGGQSVDVSVNAIEDLIGKAHAGVQWSRESSETVSFRGKPVTFAFAAVPMVIQPDRTVLFGVEAEGITFGDAAPPPTERPAIDEDGLLDFDGPFEVSDDE